MFFKKIFFKKIIPLISMFLASQTVFAYDCVMPTKSDLHDEYDSSECVFDGLIKVGKDGKYGAMDNVGIVIIPLMFDKIDAFDDGVAKVKYKDKFGFINPQGILVVPLKYDDVGFFQNGGALVRQGDEYFMVDGAGRRVLDDAPATLPTDLAGTKKQMVILSDTPSLDPSQLGEYIDP